MKSLCEGFIAHIKTRWGIDSDPDVSVFAKNCLGHLQREFERYSSGGGFVSTGSARISFDGNVGIRTDAVDENPGQRPPETNEQDETEE